MPLAVGPRPGRVPRAQAMALKGFACARFLIFVFLWYSFNVRYNIVTKHTLRSVDAPGTIAWLQMAFSIILSTCMWFCRCVPVPRLSRQDVRELVPTSVVFAIAQSATVMALSQGNVSLTHAVKSLEPVVNAIVSAVILKQCQYPLVYAALAPIIGGVGLATSAHISFSGLTMFFAMVSNVCFAVRNVLAKKTADVGKLGDGPITKKTNQVAVITIIACLVELPLVLVMSGGFMGLFKAWGHAIKNGADPTTLSLNLFESCLHFSMYQVSSFWVLSCVQPLTHSVLNSLKRVAVIAVACAFLNEDLTPAGMFGIALATAGAIIYSIAKQSCADAPLSSDPGKLCKRRVYLLGYAVAVALIVVAVGSGRVPVISSLPANVMLRSTPPAGLVPGAPSAPSVQLALQQESKTLVLVTIPSSAACNGQIHHLSCLKTVIADAPGFLRWEEKISEPLCIDLIAGRRKDILHADVGLCVQLQRDGLVGAVAKLNDSGMFQRSASASELGQVLRLLPGEPRVASRKNLYAIGFREKAAKHINPSEPEAWSAAMAVDKNLGNLIWQFGATNLINPYSSVWFASPSNYTSVLPDAMVLATANLLYIPAGNESMPKIITGKSSMFYDIVRHLNVPSAIMGIGIQAEIRDDQDIETTIQALHLHDLSVNLLSAFASRAPPAGIAVRGNITSRLCEKAGIDACVPLGCPSLTINRASNLGAILRSQWKLVVHKLSVSESSLKIAITLPQLERGGKFHERVYDILIKVYSDYDAIVVLQSDYDRPELQKRFKKAGIEWNTSRIKFFVDVQAWIHELKQVDFVMGCRIHGTMAAVSAGTASLILPTDFRTLEMAQAMDLPNVFGTELRALKVETFHLGKLIRTVYATFDFNRFERTRRAAIKAYSDMLRGMDLEIHPELLRVELGGD